MENSELLKYQLNLMTNNQVCIGFNMFFHQQFLNSGTTNSKKYLEQSEKIIENWKNLTDEDKVKWHQKEDELKQQVQSQRYQKKIQSQTHLQDLNRQKSNENNLEQHTIEDIENGINQLKFDKAKKDYFQRIYICQKEDEDKKNVKPQKQNKKNYQDKKEEILIDDNDDFVLQNYVGKKSNIRQSKQNIQKQGCGKKKM
ncbi:unnamed protein product [Paramecium sonneborni]|uniref:Uncharacterized protein n=1 Tax=Paramecium sonneborni TaxID=65129 RepID=A0A8S1K264_9CILI|nr:unnamed protein product [Paramecium sonneborni]